MMQENSASETWDPTVVSETLDKGVRYKGKQLHTVLCIILLLQLQYVGKDSCTGSETESHGGRGVEKCTSLF